MKFQSILWALIFCPLLLVGQDSRIAKNTAPLNAVPQMVMPPLDNKTLLDAEMDRRSPGIAPKFAENISVDITPDRHGYWEELPNGKLVWRLRIYSQNAKSLNLGFTQYFMPPGASLILYSPDYQRVQGPFTPADNEEHEQLWTPILKGDELVIEVQVPVSVVDDLKLELTSVNHDFLGFGDFNPLSGSCNLDVICGEDDGWGIVDEYRDIIQSVAVIGLNGGTFCTGFLVNNANEDCRPFFMTANHCDYTPGNAPSFVAYWNYFNSFCRQPGSSQSGQNGNGQLNDFNTGAIYRAGYAPSDMTLLELDDPVSETADAFFAGWSNEAVAPSSAIGIHHPNTEEKRISFEDDPLMLTNGFGNIPSANFTHVRVVDWDTGTTEPGSSGSPLFDNNKRVIGQLHGGGAACGNNQSDWYGSFSTSWEGGGAPNSRLKDWLDPDNLGLVTLDGRSQESCSFFVEASDGPQDICQAEDAVYTIQVSDNFSGPVTLSIDDVPPGADATFGMNPVMPGGSTTLTISNTNSVPGGTYDMTLAGSDGNDETDQIITLSVFAGIPGNLTLLEPIDNAQGISPNPELSWMMDSGTSSYDVQVATDASFNNLVVAEAGLSSPSLQVNGLEVNSTYYWRVRGINSCGNGSWAMAFSFDTGNITCSSDASTNVPINIPASGTPTVTSTLQIDDIGEIIEISVIDLAGTHTWLEDLTFLLTSPEGTTITLVSQICGDQDDFDINFAEGADPNIPCPYDDGGTYAPTQSLSEFWGEDINGPWTLTIQDGANQDGGQLASWGLDYCLLPTAGINVNPNTESTCENETATYQVLANESFTGPVTVSVSGAPAGSTVDISPNPVSPGQVAVVEISDLDGSAGNYNISISATDGTANANGTVGLQVIAGPLATNLNIPSNGAEMVSLSPTFTWAPVPGTTNYELELAEDENFTIVVENQMVSGTSYSYPNLLLEGETYYWRVSTSNSCGAAPSSVYSFTTEDPNSTNELAGQVVLVAPNPTDDVLQIQLTAPLGEDILIDLYSVDGKSLLQQVMGPQAYQAQLQLAAYPSGVYLLRLRTKEDVYTKRITVQH